MVTMYLFSDFLIFIDKDKSEFFLHLPISSLNWVDTGENSFDLIIIEGSIKRTYHAICNSKEEKEEWMKQHTILGIINSDMIDQTIVEEEDNPFLRNDGSWNIQYILTRMMDIEQGILIPSITIRLTTYKNVINGSNAVLWLTKNVTQKIEDSLKIGELWMAENLITPISKKENFRDKKNSYYSLTFGKCLNCTNMYWFKSVRSPIDVSIDLLSQVVKIFKDNRVMVSKYKIEGMNLMSLDPSYYEFHTNTAELQLVDIKSLTENEKFIFFVNVYNTLALHSYIAQHNNISTKGLNELNCISFLSKNKYNIGGFSFSLYQIDHAIIRGNLSFPEVFLSSKVNFFFIQFRFY